MSRPASPTGSPGPGSRSRAVALGKRLLLLTGLAGVGAFLAAAVAARVGGPGAAGAALVGSGAAWIAALAGSLPATLARGERPADRANALLAGMVLRFLLSLLLGTAALVLGGFDRGPLLLALAAIYVLLLTAETWLDLGAGGGDKNPGPPRRSR